MHVVTAIELAGGRIEPLPSRERIERVIAHFRNIENVEAQADERRHLSSAFAYINEEPDYTKWPRTWVLAGLSKLLALHDREVAA